MKNDILSKMLLSGNFKNKSLKYNSLIKNPVAKLAKYLCLSNRESKNAEKTETENNAIKIGLNLLTNNNT